MNPRGHERTKVKNSFYTKEILRLFSIHHNLIQAIALAGILFSTAALSAAGESKEERLDSLENKIDNLEKSVLSTLLFGGSSPVSFSGEARLKLQYHHFEKYPEFMRDDRSWLQANWEGNESLVRLGMVVRANRNTVLWAKLGFQHTLPGVWTNEYTGDTLAQYRHDKGDNQASIHEDMCAGIALRTVPASFWLKMGAVHWIEASPFTIWKSQPRTFAWDYLPYEIEQPIARYYEYNIAKGEKTGRAAWNKKAFQGINLESINLPADLYFNFLYGTFERYDNFEREYIDFSNDLAYAGELTEAKGRGIGDTYRHIIHGRVAKDNAFLNLTPGLNYLTMVYRKDLINLSPFLKVFGTQRAGNRAFFKEPSVFSADLRGKLLEKLGFHLDIASSVIDTSFFSYDSTGFDTETQKNIVTRTDENRKSVPRIAFYSQIKSDYGIPIQADIAVVPKGFYSPLSFAPPMDAFFPFGSNLVGPGKFVARGEGSPYVQNMAGINVSVVPKLKGYGHLRFTYGQHFQLEKARDLLYFPYRLNGQDLFNLFHSSYNRWGNNLVDHSMNGEYSKRLGDESYHTKEYGSPVGFAGGGMRSDYLNIYEGFVPYQSAAEADSNLNDISTIFTRSPFVPQHKKYTFNFELDAAYDIGSYIGYDKDLFISGYFALNGVSTAFKPLAFNDESDDMLLWGTYFRFEPAIALTKSFYLLGLAGFENWRSQKAYMQDTSGVAVHKPIDFMDMAFGLGFDWDIFSRVGLHGRAKWMKHDDVNFPDNNWETPILSTEIKMWF
ncbi:MAG: hypothetical protein GF401_16085 [Chitinivibrionales bacterium]|nr:hypothetical protein [Chitinivibrionales bacterium]